LRVTPSSLDTRVSLTADVAGALASAGVLPGDTGTGTVVSGAPAFALLSLELVLVG
jgi:hypothetical protein